MSAVDIARLEIEPEALSLMVGDTARLVATLRDESGNTLSGRSVTWSSGDPDVALVDGGGRVAALASGTTVIAATSGGIRDEATLAVGDRPAIGVDRSTVVFAAPRGTSPPPAEVALTADDGAPIGGLTAVVAYGPGQPSGWLDASLSGNAAPATLTLSPLTSALDVGQYTATVTIGSPQARAGTTVSVTLDVLDPGPLLRLDRTAVTIKATAAGGNPAPETVRITNGGTGTVEDLAIRTTYRAGEPTGWLTTSLGSTTAPATLTLSASTNNLAAGSYTAAVEVTAAGASNNPQTLAVTLDVGAPPPTIDVEPLDLVLTATAGAGDPNPVNLAVRNSGSGSIAGLTASVRYPAGQSGAWLTAAIAPATAPTTLRIQAYTSGLSTGTHTAFIDVSAPDVANSPVTITVTLNLNPAVVAPTIALTPGSLSFSATAGGADPAAQSVNVSNGGGGALHGLGVSVSYAAGQPTGWLDAALSGTTAPATLDVKPVTGSLPAGTYNATVAVESSAAANSPQSIDVTFTVTAAPVPPAIVVTPTSLTFDATAGGSSPSQQTVDIANSGGGTLDSLTVSVRYASGQPTGWLNASLAGTSAPTTVSVQPATGSLAAGTYDATIDVVSSVASNSPQSIDVTFTVAPAPAPPAIAASPTSLSFTATENGANPAPAAIDITNAGGGTLDNLALSVTHASGQSGGWLTATLAAQTAPTTIPVQAETGSLAAGSYNATITVSSSVASNSPVNISVTFEIQPASVQPPNAPSNLEANAGRRYIDLRWNDNSNNETSFVIERSLLPTLGWVVLDTLPADSTKYRDSGVVKGTLYYYRVSACNSAGCSTSAVVSERT